MASLFVDDATTFAPNAATAVTVRSLEDAFRWSEHQLGALGGDSARALLAAWSPASKASMSTAFSGIGAPEQAVHSLRAYLAHRFPSSPTSVDQVSAIEWNAFSRAELRAAPCPPRHLFCDMTEFIHPAIRKGVLARGAKSGWTTHSLWQTLSQPNAVRLVAMCDICAAPCTFS